MRAFAALEVPEAVHADLDLTLATPIRRSPPARWIPARDRHLTLVFLGSVDPSALEELHESLSAVCASGEPLELELFGGGVFPVGKPARIVWAGIRPSSGLMRFQADCARACAGLGFPVERRTYLPHLTLARCRPPWSAAAGEAWRSACESRLDGSGAAGWFTVHHATLFESSQSAAGVQYEAVRTYPLGGGRTPRGHSIP